MTERNTQPEQQPQELIEAPAALKDDLASLFGGQVDVSTLRRSMAEASRDHFAQFDTSGQDQSHDALHESSPDTPQPIRAWWARWPISAGAGVGMAAAIGLVVWINSFAPVHNEAPSNVAVVLAGDIDSNGKVDILDAYQLQRRIEHFDLEASIDVGVSMVPEWDMNGDGQVNREDVAAIAMLAVKIEGGTRS